jgi:hypothetical protein
MACLALWVSEGDERLQMDEASMLIQRMDETESHAPVHNTSL